MKKIFLPALCLIFINVAISGATSPAAPKISVKPASVNFGPVALGAKPVPQVVMIKNTGTSNLIFNAGGVSITGADSAEFEQTNSCGIIAPGESCPVNVTFKPALPYAKKTALLTLASNDPKKPTLHVKLSAQVPPPKIAAIPSSVNFGKLLAGTAISTKSVTIENKGLSDLVINSIDIAGTDPGDFMAVSSCGTVPNGGSCGIGVAFQPLAPKGMRSATLDITSNDPKKPTLKLKLSGSSRGDNTISLPQTGQTKCYDAAGSVISCAGTGQNGALQEGVAWPIPRFTNNNDGTITDDLTGLMWTQDTNAPGPAGCNPGVKKHWQEALDYVACLNTNDYLGHNDWRLPNRKELRSLVHYGQSNSATWLNTQGFSNVQSSYYWSSTSSVGLANAAWTLAFTHGGYVFFYAKTINALYVWPVRTAHPKSDNLPKTGQTTCYDAAGNVISCAHTGQDGALRKGIAWPHPRFKDNGDETITDKLTGLIWTQDANAPGTACTPGVTKTWQGALDYIACLNTNTYLGHNDWRLPNVNELESLIHSGNYTATWLNTQGFSNVQNGSYWSSTTSALSTTSAWFVYVGPDYVDNTGKTANNYVWPVRAGQ